MKPGKRRPSLPARHARRAASRVSAGGETWGSGRDPAILSAPLPPPDDAAVAPAGTRNLAGWSDAWFADVDLVVDPGTGRVTVRSKPRALQASAASPSNGDGAQHQTKAPRPPPEWPLEFKIGFAHFLAVILVPLLLHILR